MMQHACRIHPSLTMPQSFFKKIRLVLRVTGNGRSATHQKSSTDIEIHQVRSLRRNLARRKMLVTIRS
ncbi:MAG: hypothetical protein KatS3mg104_2412 [Phycisphaerae bacterium]|nr:MAG: hypothetical protein KatS3mg104_2412 [Phycisphaerae bacterium]